MAVTEATEHDQRVLTPRAETSRRLYDLTEGGNVYYDGQRTTDKYAAWTDGHGGIPSSLFGREPGQYAVKAKGPDKAACGSDVPNIAGLFERWDKPELTSLTWLGVAYHVPGPRAFPTSGYGRQQASDRLLQDLAPIAVCDAWVRSDGQAGHGDRFAPIFTNVRYRPLLMNTSDYGALTAWVDLDAPASPIVVRSHRDECVALVMPVKTGSDGVVHITEASA